MARSTNQSSGSVRSEISAGRSESAKYAFKKLEKDFETSSDPYAPKKPYSPSDLVGEIRKPTDSFNSYSKENLEYKATQYLVDAFDVRNKMVNQLIENYYEQKSNEGNVFEVSANVDLPYKGYNWTFNTSVDVSGMPDKQAEKEIKNVFKEGGKLSDNQFYSFDVYKRKLQNT